MAAGQLVTQLNVREDENGELFLEACHAIKPCGCEVVGAGTLNSLLDIKYCPMHAAVTEDEILRFHFEHGANWVETFRYWG